jgi:hypothetical protein
VTFRHSWRRVLAAAAAATAVMAGAVLATSTAAQANPVQGIGLQGGAICTPDYVKAGWQLTNANTAPATVTQLDAGPVEMSGLGVGSVVPAAAGGQPGQVSGVQEFSPAYNGPFSLAVTVDLGGQSVSLSLSFTIDEECEPQYGDPGTPTTPPATQPPTTGPTATPPPATAPTTPAAAGPSLPVTGGDPLPIVAAGLALLLGGALLALVIARRRNRFVS